jgi:DNA-directed RNA polymerase subunit H
MSATATTAPATAPTNAAATTAGANSSNLISSLYKSRQIILQLLDAQGYEVKDYQNGSIHEINSMFQNKQLDMLVEQRATTTATATTTNQRKRKVYVNYFLGKTLSTQNVQEIIDDLFYLEQVLTKEDTLYIITRSDSNETLTQLMKHIWEQDGILVILQNIKRLQFNILEHELVPVHRVMSQEEKEAIMRKYNLTQEDQFPEISRFDPVAQAIFLRPGDVCEIKRYHRTALASYYYRLCV